MKVGGYFCIIIFTAFSLLFIKLLKVEGKEIKKENGK